MNDRHAPHDGVLTVLRRQLAAHVPTGDVEAAHLARVRRLLTWLPAPLDEYADPTHVTGSAVVFDGRGRVLLHRHKRLGRWLQPGGHLEPGESPWDAAARETAEETGLTPQHPAAGPLLLHVDVHEGPRGHVHLDLRYLLYGDGHAPLVAEVGAPDDLGWFAPDRVRAVSDRSLGVAIDRASHDGHVPS